MNKQINCTIDGEDVILPKYETLYASGLDLRAWKYSLPNDLKTSREFSVEGFTLRPHQRILIKTGLHIELPEDTEAQLRPKSGLAIKNGIVAQLGTIDEDYHGDIGIILLNTSEDNFTIFKDDRLGQLVFANVVKYDLNIVDKLSETMRGENGFGSTGIK
jgi:dUTP pyrophosphatase